VKVGSWESEWENDAVLVLNVEMNFVENEEHEKLNLHAAEYCRRVGPSVALIRVSLTLVSSLCSGNYFQVDSAGSFDWTIENGCHSRWSLFDDQFQVSLDSLSEPSASSRCLGLSKSLGNPLALAEPILVDKSCSH